MFVCFLLVHPSSPPPPPRASTFSAVGFKMMLMTTWMNCLQVCVNMQRFPGQKNIRITQTW